MSSRKYTLEERLRILANAGELSHLSICPTAGKGPGGIVYSASFSPASAWGHGFARDADPVNALMAALDDERFASLTKKLKIDTSEVPTVVPKAPTPAEQHGGIDAVPAGEDWLKAE
jgi:hypothetical protein